MTSFAHLDLGILCHSPLQILSSSVKLDRPLMDSHCQISPEKFDWVQVKALAGPLKDIHRVLPKLLLCRLGCVLRVIVLLEGEPSAKNDVWVVWTTFSWRTTLLCSIHLSFSRSLPLKNTTSPLGWYWAGDKWCLVSSRCLELRPNSSILDLSDQRILFLTVWESFSSWVVHWGEAFVSPLYRKAQIGEVLQCRS